MALANNATNLNTKDNPSQTKSATPSSSTDIPVTLPKLNDLKHQEHKTPKALSLEYTLAQAGPPPNGNNNPVDSAFYALRAGVKAVDAAANNDKNNSVGHAKDGVDKAANAASGMLRILNSVTKGTPLEDAGNIALDYGTKATDLTKALANLGINTTDMIWSNNPAQNVANFQKMAGLLMNSNNDIVKLDSEIRTLAIANPQSLEAVKNISDALTQMTSIYDKLKQDGLDPAMVDPKFGKFMDRVRDTGKNFSDFSTNYSEYADKSKSLPQMGTVSDAVDYLKCNFDFTGAHRIQRIERNVAAGEAMKAWGEFKANFNKVTTLADFN